MNSITTIQIIAAGASFLVGAMAVSGAAMAQEQKPRVKVQAPGVKVVVPEEGGVQVQAPGVKVQTPAATVQGDPLYPRTPWFSSFAIREELKLSEQQYSHLNDSYQKAWTKYNKERNLLKDNLTPEQRVRREGELRQDFHKQFSPALTSTFVEPATRLRYNQLHMQFQGYDAFLDSNIQQELNLTAEQVRELNRLGSAWNKQISTWRAEYRDDQERIDKQLRDARRQQRQQIDNLLTAEQRKKWEALQGPAYEFQSEVYFPADATTSTLKPVLK